MAERANIKPRPRSAVAVSFGWLSVLPKLLRLQTVSIMGRDAPEPQTGLVPVYCPDDDPPTTFWVPPAAVGSVYCDDRRHWAVPMQVKKDLLGEGQPHTDLQIDQNDNDIRPM